MTHFTEQELLILEQRRNPAPNTFGDDTPDPGLESSLVKKIRKFIRDNGLVGVCFLQTIAIRKILPPGFPD